MTVVAYHAPATIDEAVSLLAAHGEAAAVLSGGTVLVPEVSRPDAGDRAVVDVRRLGLAGIERRGAVVHLGAATTYGQLLASDIAASALPILHAAARGVTGGPQIRNQGTVGGSACYANPSSDVPACLVAAEASMGLCGPRGRRAVPAREFFLDAFSTARAADELLAAIECPVPRGDVRVGYRKFKLAESSWPIVTAAAVVRPDGGGRIVLGAVARRPQEVELPAGIAAAEVGRCVQAAIDAPWGDVLADVGYRLRIAPEIARRAFLAAVDGGDDAG